MLSRIASNAWNVEVADAEYLGGAPTMLAIGERKMLHWLAREMPGNGAIVDAGSFLGGSALALATGLRRPARIICYDQFITPRDAYHQGMIGRHTAGESFLDLFERNVGDYPIDIHVGDFIEAEAPPDQIDILFIDISKNLDLETRVRQHFFPKLIPGHSIVVHQDYNYHSNPWVVLSMEHLADYVIELANQDTSRVFYVREPIPSRLLAIDLAHDLSPAQRLDLMDTSLEKERANIVTSPHREIAYLHVMMKECAKAVLLAVDYGEDAALCHLAQLPAEIPAYSWRDTNLRTLDNIVRSLHDGDGFARHRREFFAPILPAQPSSASPRSAP